MKVLPAQLLLPRMHAAPRISMHPTNPTRRCVFSAATRMRSLSETLQALGDAQPRCRKRRESFVYHSATHDFDDPGVRRQRVKENAEAAQDAFTRARNFIIQLFRP